MKGPVYRCLTALALLGGVGAAEIDMPPTQEIVDKASQIASSMLLTYNDSSPYFTPGLLSESDWTLSSTTMWSAVIEYWYYTGKKAFNDVTSRALVAQAGEKHNFARNFSDVNSPMTADLGLWGSVALLAAERDFPQPAKVDMPWIKMAEGAFEGFASYWNEDGKCGGGIPYLPKIVADNLRPSIPEFKDMLTQGTFFSMAARLARFTGDKKYADWADKTWAWVEKTRLLDIKTYTITEPLVSKDCKLDPDQLEDNEQQVSSNALLVLGAAFMYNTTGGDSKWETRLTGLVDHALKQWFEKSKGVLVESCEEEDDDCGTDWKTLKGASISMYAEAIQVAPFLKEKLYPVIIKSGAAAMHSCREMDEDGAKVFSCGYHWGAAMQLNDVWPPFHEIAALNAVAPLLMESSKPPQNSKDAGTIQGDGKGDGKDGKNEKGDDKKSAAMKASVDMLGVLSLAAVAALL